MATEEEIERCAERIHSALVSEHGTFPRDAIPKIAEALRAEIGGLPNEEQVGLLVFGEEDEEGFSIPERITLQFPVVHRLLNELCT